VSIRDGDTSSRNSGLVRLVIERRRDGATTPNSAEANSWATMYSDNPGTEVPHESFEVDRPGDSTEQFYDEPQNLQTSNGGSDHEEQALVGGTSAITRTPLSALAEFISESWYPVYFASALLVALMIVAIMLVPGKNRPVEGQLPCELQFTGNTSWATLQHIVANSTEFRCVEPEPWGKPCQCQNPTVGQQANTTGWQNAAANNLDYIANATATNERHLDVVMVGDSITEHWHGTDLGIPVDRYANNVEVYDKLFNLQSGAKISGLALGIGGDRCSQLLYRLQNGEMPATLQPELWWVLVGTNDKGTDQCKNEDVIVGNIAIVEYILKERPLATVVINSLLPRGSSERLYWWDDYTVINKALECYASEKEQVEFFNATDLFVTTNGKALNKTLLPDEIHPEELGSWVWGRAIVAKVQEILDYRRRK